MTDIPLTDFLYYLQALIFPERCPYCNNLIEPKEIACESCMKKLEERQRPLTGGALGFRCLSSFHYKGSVRRAIVNLKFFERTQYIPQMAVILAADIRQVYGEGAFDLITAVPMYKTDRIKRGYNQSELIAKAVGKLLDLPYLETLEKIKKTKKQHTLKYAKRKHNLDGAFQVINNEEIHQKRILIVDDIVTSGYTLGKCCRIINRARPKTLCCATLAAARNYYEGGASI